jgi:flagellar hook-basal body complex protein FliE
VETPLNLIEGYLVNKTQQTKEKEMKKETIEQYVRKVNRRLKWIEESTKDFIKTSEKMDSDKIRILNDILIACDLNDDEPEKYWRKK